MPVADFKTYCGILDRARAGCFALPAVNVTSLTTANAVLRGLAESKSDGIIQVSTGGGAFASGSSLKDMALGAISIAEHVHRAAQRYPIFVALHTDHCLKDKLDKFVLPLVEETEKRRAAGQPNLFTGHMFDGSNLSLGENLDISASLLERFAKNDLVLEIETGAVGGEEDDVVGDHSAKLYTTPEDTLEVARRLNAIGGRYLLAATFGNVHGVYKPGHVKLKPGVLKDCQDAVVKTHGEGARFHLVFHGGSGSTQDEIHESLDYGVVKMNVDTDMQYAFTRAVAGHVLKNYDGVLKVDGELGNKKVYDPRSYLALAEAAMAARVKQAASDLRGTGKDDVRVMNTQLPDHKTKIVATIGPASQSPEMLERLIRAGLNVARLNFSHGDFAFHGELVRRIRAAAQATGRRVAIMADLPGPKMRLGAISPEPIQLVPGDHFTLTSDEIVGDATRVSMSFTPLPRVVKKGNRLFLNDGLVQLVVEEVAGNDVKCVVAVGGELRSRKGLNLPGIDLGISAFTDHDRACLEFALGAGVDAVSQSFVERAADIEAVRTEAARIGQRPFIIAKIERSDALAHYDEILAAADGIMVARGDLGVEVPIEEIAHTQKQLIAKANLAGKPVITATQMLESMVASRLPTRAEATDVANAILDGTDCVMLSGESAMGKFPEEAVVMLARIASFTESRRPHASLAAKHALFQQQPELTGGDRIALLVEHALETVPCDTVLVPTRGGTTARAISRCKPSVWIVAVSSDPVACQGLAFSYGVHPVDLASEPPDWREFATRWLLEHEIPAERVMLVAGPSPRNPRANHRIELMRLSDS